MPLRLLRPLALAWFVLIFCVLSCGGDPPAGTDPCRLPRCDAEGVTETVFRRDIAQLSGSGLSLMPEGMETAISIQQMADLIAFLLAPQ